MTKGGGVDVEKLEDPEFDSEAGQEAGAEADGEEGVYYESSSDDSTQDGDDGLSDSASEQTVNIEAKEIAAVEVEESVATVETEVDEAEEEAPEDWGWALIFDRSVIFEDFGGNLRVGLTLSMEDRGFWAVVLDQRTHREIRSFVSYEAACSVFYAKVTLHSVHTLHTPST
jgi:hypothetical protein